MQYRLEVKGTSNPEQYITLIFGVNEGQGLGQNLDEHPEIAKWVAGIMEGQPEVTEVTLTHEETVTVQDYPSP